MGAISMDNSHRDSVRVKPFAIGRGAWRADPMQRFSCRMRCKKQTVSRHISALPRLPAPFRAFLRPYTCDTPSVLRLRDVALAMRRLNHPGRRDGGWNELCCRSRRASHAERKETKSTEVCVCSCTGFVAACLVEATPMPPFACLSVPVHAV